VNPEISVRYPRSLAADEGLDAREVKGEAVAGVPRRGDDPEGPAAAEVNSLAVLENPVHLEAVEKDVLLSEKRLVLLLVIYAEAPDQVDGVGFLEDIGRQTACCHLEAWDVAPEVGDRSGVVEMRVGDEDPSQAALVAEVMPDLAKVGGPHEGDPRVEEGRGLGRHEPGGQIDVRQRVETLDDFAGLPDDHGPVAPPSRPVGMLEEGL